MNCTPNNLEEKGCHLSFDSLAIKSLQKKLSNPHRFRIQAGGGVTERTQGSPLSNIG